MDIPRTKMCLDTIILATINMDWREYRLVHWDGVRAKTRGKKYPKGKLLVIKKLKKTFRNRFYRAYLLS